MATTPIFITCRDRLEPLLALLGYLERAGQHEIYLLDNDSTYPPLLEYLAKSPHHVIRLGRNVGHLALWDAGVLSELNVTGRYVCTDPDIVPEEACPPDAIEYFGEVLDAYPDRAKVGFGLILDDLPDSYTFKREVVVWESQFWDRPLAPGLFDAPIDTTFALYRRPQPPGFERSLEFEHSIRTGYPYVARHAPWYVDDNCLSDEEAYYRSHARPDVNHWSRESLPDWLAEAIAAREAEGTSAAQPVVRDPGGKDLSAPLRRAHRRLRRRI